MSADDPDREPASEPAETPAPSEDPSGETDEGPAGEVVQEVVEEDGAPESDQDKRALSPQAHLTLGLIIPMVVAAFNMWRLRGLTIDDSYISFRYARNLARGHGLVFNVGERIEGYTNFLWTVLLAGCHRLGFDLVQSSKVLGAGFALGGIFFVYRLSIRALPTGRTPVVATWLLASTGVYCGYAVFGLETAMVTCLVLAAAYRVLDELDDPKAKPWSGLLIGLAAITRPDSVIYAAIIVLMMPGKAALPLPKFLGRLRTVDRRAVVLITFAMGLLFLGLRTRFRSASSPVGGYFMAGGAVLVLLAFLALPKVAFSKQNLMRTGIAVVIAGTHLLWRKSYYGDWVPNTVHAKTGDWLQQSLGGRNYVMDYLVHEGPLLALVVFGMAAAVAWRNRVLLTCAAVFLVMMFYVWAVGGDWMPVFRFMAPVQPWIFILAGVAARSFVDEGTTKGRHSAMLAFGVGIFAAITIVHRIEIMRQDTGNYLGATKKFWDKAAGGVAEWHRKLAEEVGADEVRGRIAMGDIGEIAYKTDLPVLDLLGLVDPVIARLPGGYTRKVGPGYRDRVFDVMPRYILLISHKNSCYHPAHGGSRILFQDRRFKKNYLARHAVPVGGEARWCIFERGYGGPITITTNRPGPYRTEKNPTSGWGSRGKTPGRQRPRMNSIPRGPLLRKP